jgi:TPR repeat protein
MNSGANGKLFVTVMALWAAAARLGAMPSPYDGPLSAVKIEANRGNPEAQYLLGLRYGFGDGVRADPVAAERWLRVAAESGLVDAQADLGEFYFLLGPEYAWEGKKWLAAAAGGGDGEAITLLESLAGKGSVGARPRSQEAGSGRAAADRTGLAAEARGAVTPTPGPNSDQAIAGIHAGAEPGAEKSPVAVRPKPDASLDQRGPAGAQPEGDFSKSWRMWALGAVVAAALTTVFLGGRRS